jgi:hypothetical protein
VWPVGDLTILGMKMGASSILSQLLEAIMKYHENMVEMQQQT